MIFLFADYHVHLDKLEWSMNTIESICRRAEDAGVDKVGLVVHTKILDGFEPLYEHILSDGSSRSKFKFDRDTEDYIKLIDKAKRLKLPVETGVEICYSPQGEDFLCSKLASCSFDYKIGSVHLIEGRHYKTAIELYKDEIKVGRLYYELVLKAASSGLFDVIGHIEVARREGIPGLDYYPDLLESICSALVKHDCAVEINTKWLLKHDYITPAEDTLKFMEIRGVKLVFGSDAHHMERIGYGKADAEAAIKKAGYTSFSLLL